MLPEAAKESLLKVVLVAGECIRQGVHLPSLILVYSGIDALGWLSHAEPHPSPRLTFVSWVERWLLPASPLPCTSLELWAARCGVLHTFTAASRHSSQGLTRRLSYAWGGASVADLQADIDDKMGPGQAVAVDIDALYDGFRLGATSFLQDAVRDPVLCAVVEVNARQYFQFVRPY